MKCQTCNCEADSRFDPLCGYCRAAKLSDERFGLQRQLAAVTAERDEAVALLREIHKADVEAIQAIKLLGGESDEPFYADRLAAIINKETP